MPHQCTNCDRVFADGSKEMLSGCPDCGGNKFQFKPKSATRTGADSDGATPSESGDSNRPGSADATRSSEPPSTSSSSSASPGAPSDDSSGRSSSSTTDPSSSTSEPPEPHSRSSADEPASSADRSAPSSTSKPSEASPEEDGTDAEIERRDEAAPDGRRPAEGNAQASARSDMVTPDELADAASASPPTNDVDGRVIEPQNDDRPGLDDLREELNSQFESIKIVSPGQYELNLMELYDRQEYIISLQEDGRYVIEVPDSWDDRSVE